MADTGEEIDLSGAEIVDGLSVGEPEAGADSTAAVLTVLSTARLPGPDRVRDGVIDLPRVSLSLTPVDEADGLPALIPLPESLAVKLVGSVGLLCSET